mgnify:FL=1
MEEKLLDIGSERAVLAGLLQYGVDVYISVSDIVTCDTFVNENNKILFKCIEDTIQNDQKPDIATILASATKLKLAEHITTKQELNYIKSLYDFPISESNVYNFAIQIKKFEFARNIRRLTQDIHKDVEKVSGSESIDEIINILEEPVTDFL